MSERPLVSVCVPTYNYARFLRKCIESVQSQTFGDWELVISDDCSTDNTAEIVEEYQKNDPRIRFQVNAKRLGMNGNIKKAADSGSGKYLKVLCSDDWLAPNCLATFFELMEEHPQAVLATSAEILSSEAGEPIRPQFVFGQAVSIIPGKSMLDGMSRGKGFGGNSSFFIRSETYRAIGGYNAECHYAADYDLGARLCRLGDYLHTDETLFYGRAQAESSSSNDPRKLLDVMDWFEIPDRIFQPRRFGDREWRRHQNITARLTARYMVNVILQWLRGDRVYAGKLLRILIERGNFLLGVPMLLLHVPTRLYRRLARSTTLQSLPPSIERIDPDSIPSKVTSEPKRLDNARA